MVQTSYPSSAKVFMTEYSPCLGTVRSKLGRDETEEPCTRNSTGSGLSPGFGAPTRLRKRLRETGPFLAQYSPLQILPGGFSGFVAAPWASAGPAPSSARSPAPR